MFIDVFSAAFTFLCCYRNIKLQDLILHHYLILQVIIMTVKVSQVIKRRITVTVHVSPAFSDCQENLWLYCQVAALEVLNDFWLQKAVLSAFV